MNLNIIAPLFFGILAFITCALVYRYLPKFLAKLRQNRVKPTGPQRAEAIQSIRASLEDIYKHLEEFPTAITGPQKNSAIGILYRCGISSSDIAEQLHMSQGEVDLTIQVNGRRAQRMGQNLSLT